MPKYLRKYKLQRISYIIPLVGIKNSGAQGNELSIEELVNYPYLEHDVQKVGHFHRYQPSWPGSGDP